MRRLSSPEIPDGISSRGVGIAIRRVGDLLPYGEIFRR